MIVRRDFARSAVFASLLSILAGAAAMAAPAGAEGMAPNLGNVNFALQHIAVEAGNTVIWTNADNIGHVVASASRAIKPKVLDTEYDIGVICETQKQAERFAMLFDGDEHTAVATVNAEERDPSACAVETVAFVRGASLATARSRADTFAVVEILVFGVDLGSGFQSIAPGAYFMLVKIDERNA